MSPTQKNKSPSSKIRIIGGMWRGRKLSVPHEKGLRPTGDRVRETLFNWIAAYVPEARCLDAFAGTGALGLEALSRGAQRVDFIELESRTASALSHNLATLQETQSDVHCTNFTQWTPKEQQKYDLIFIDPPFDNNLWDEAISHIIATQILANDALIYVESRTTTSISIPIGWNIKKQKKLGQIQATVYETTKLNQDKIPTNS